MTELQPHNSGFSNIDWLNRRNMNSSNSTNTTYGQQPQQSQVSLNSSYYAHQLPPINSISSTNNSIAQLNHESVHMNDDERKQQPPLVPWDNIPSATTTTDSTVSANSSSYDAYQQNNNNTVSTPSPSMSTDKSSTKKQRIPSTKDIHVEKNTDGKPPYSYATLIKYAIENSPNKKLTLSEIYQWVLEHYPYYSTAGSGWKNSIRHNLSLNKSFVRIARPINEPGKGSYWMVDYRSVETEQRTRHLLPSTGNSDRRNNRSGSDPSSNTPYRPEWSTSSFGRRDMRDARSLSMDAATALSKNTNGVGLGGSYSTGHYKSMAPESTGGGGGYYGNAYAYGRQFATAAAATQQRTTALRHNSTHYMPSPGYNVYMENIPTDQYHHQQLPASQHNHHHYSHHHHHHHQQQQQSSSSAKLDHPNFIYQQPTATAAAAATSTGSQQPQMYYNNFGNGQPSSAPTSMIEKAPDLTTTTATSKSIIAEHAVCSTPTPSTQLPSFSTAIQQQQQQQQQQQPSNYHPHITTSSMSHLATSTTTIREETSRHPTAATITTPSNMKSGKQHTTSGEFDWETVL